MKITAVIPAYNAEKTVARAIESVLAQTRPADEIIVVDDGSADHTSHVVQSFGDKVTLIRQENAGASVARNTGIEAARGDWIAFLDCDDEWLPEKLRLQSEHLSRNPDLHWTTGNYYRCHCEQNHRHVTDMSPGSINTCRTFLSGREFFDDYFKAYTLLAKGHTDMMLIRRDLLFEAGLFLPGQKRMNDEDMWLRIGYVRPQIGFVFEPLAIYHLGVPNSIVKIHTDWKIIDTFLDRHFELAEKAARKDALRPCARMWLSYWMRILMTEGQGSGIRHLIRRYGGLLVPSFKTSCYLGSFCPPLWNAKEKIKKQIRSAIRSR